MKYWLHREAEEELGDAAEHYARHASPAVAEAFITEFETARDRIIANQQLGAIGEYGFRTLRFDRFPWTLVYEAHPEGPRIYAIAHQHRSPGYWRGRA